MSALTFRTTDPTRWGTGQTADLSAAQIDNNFWFLYSTVLALQDHANGNADIDYFVVNGNQLFVHLTNHAVLGPYILPTAQWHPRGAWAPVTAYGLFDTVIDDGALYLIIWAHTSLATFDANSSDGLGHSFYSLLLSQPANMMPTGGTVGQRLAKVSATDFEIMWKSDHRNLGLFIQGATSPSELLLQYVVTENLSLPIGLAGSQGFTGDLPTAAISYALAKNGTSIGSVNFGIVSHLATFTFPSAVSFVPGDTLTLVGPASPDEHQRDVSFTLKVTLTDAG